MDRPVDHPAAFAVRVLEAADRPWVRRLVSDEWGLPVVSPSGRYDPSTLPGFVADERGRPLGVVTYRLSGDGCEVITLNSLEERRGVGTALLSAVKQVADRRGARLWLITTDDNVDAIAFYERRGMSVRRVHRDFVEVVRAHKPRAGSDAYRDAIEFSF
jgi:GNAT superfamily N-acetyltransferase